jgi:SAM-dependent methyltransferase
MAIVRAYYERIAAEIGSETTFRAAASGSASASENSSLTLLASGDRPAADKSSLTPFSAAYVPSAAAAAGRADFATIAPWVARGSQVLDLGCGDGSLLTYLARERAVRGYGIEIDDAGVLACVASGVSVLQGNLDTGLAGFDDASFDCVILSQTLQAMHRIEHIVMEMLRVGREAIVTFPNFGHGRTAGRSSAGACPCRRRCRTSGTTRRTSTCARSPISTRSLPSGGST